MTTDTTHGPTWIVAHDFSPCADDAADLAVDDLLRERRGGRVVLVHVYSVMMPAAPIEGAPLATTMLQLEQATLVESTERLEAVAARLRERARRAGNGAGLEIEVRARAGTPAEAVVEEAAACGAERIVVGTHGRRGVSHFILGSVAERIARLASVPVLIAHARAPVASTHAHNEVRS